MRTPFYHEDNHYGFFAKCPTSFYNLPIKKHIFYRLAAFAVTLTLAISLCIPAYAMGESGSAAVGWGTTFFITKDGALYGFGKNAEGLIPGGNSYVDEPMQLLSDAKSVCSNRYAVMVIKRDLSLWYWGRLPGVGSTTQPMKIEDNVISMAIDAGNNQSVLIAKSDGSMYKMDSGTDKDFQQVQHSQKIKFVAIGGYNKFFINESNELWGWCTNKNGSTSLGVGHEDPVLEPVKIMDDVQAVAADNFNTMIIRSDATLWMCGKGDQGKFYNGQTEVEGPVLTPVKIMDNVLQAAAYDSAFIAVKKDNTLWAWGDNVNSDLGSSHLSQPIQWTTGIAYFSLGYQHFAAIKTDNTLLTGGKKDGVYHATQTSGNALRLTAENLQDAPAAWAMAEVREAEYRKLVPPAMQSDYTKIVTRSEFCTLAITCIEQTTQMTIENYLISQGVKSTNSSPFTDISGLSDRARADIQAAYTLQIINGTSTTTFS